VVAVPLCVLCAALTINLWVGSLPAVASACNQLTGGPLPDQTDRVPAPVTHQTSARPITGIVVPIAIPANASKFAHRRELVYLPPTWFASNPLPASPP
jgi:hypothetical protein